MPRHPDPAAAATRLISVLPRGLGEGGWVPPADLDPGAEAVDPPPVTAPPAEEAGEEAGERSWSGVRRGRPGEPAAGLAAGLPAGLLPATLRGGRWDPGRSGLAALAVVAVLAAAVSGALLLRGRAQVLPAPAASGTAGPASLAAGSVVVVDVAGKVRRPGIVRLPLGARVDDAVRAAGGPLPGASYAGLNRARKLTDGEQVVVGTVAGAAAQMAADGRLDLNAADVAALDGLPGIGPVLAQKIVDWRVEHGRFASVDQLREVGGIGESKFRSLKSKVRV